MRCLAALPALLFAGQLFASTTSALPEKWRNWLYFRPLVLEDTTETRLAHVTLPMEVLGRAQQTLADVRVVDQGFREVPYFLHVRRPQQRRNWLAGRVTELGFAPGEYTHLVVDTGSGGSLHNRAEITLEEKDFFAWVEVASSEDRESWRVLRGRAPIYRFPLEQVGSSTLLYPDTRARWLRLRILDGQTQFHVESCRVAYELVEKADYVDLPVALTPVASEPGASEQEDRWDVDSGLDNVLASAVEFEADQEEFHRPVRISTSRDGKNWVEVGQGDIYRFHATDPALEESASLHASLKVEIPEVRSRFWRVAVLNRNDLPVRGLRPRLQVTRHRVVLRQEPGTEYWLLYGNSKAVQPRYDLSQLTSRQELDRAVAGNLGSETTNSGYVSPEPWSERHPVVLWLVLAVAVVVLGTLAVRSLRQA